MVLGGGPAGSAAAIVLARAGRGTLIVERTDAISFKAGESVPPAARPLLRDLDVWRHLESDGHLPSRGVESAWGEPTLRTTHFLADPHGHGWQLDRTRFDARLRSAAVDAGAHLETTAVAALTRIGDRWRATLVDGAGHRDVSARWVIDCTGRRAWASRAIGVSRIGHDRLVGLVMVYAQQDPIDRDATTLVESAPDGWWYTARIPNGRRVVVYLTDADDESARRARTREGFVEMAAETVHVRERLARQWCVPAEPPGVVSADTSRLERFAGREWLAAGDAAASFDPLSSQGIYTALYAGMRAAHALIASEDRDVSAIEGYAAAIDSVYATYLARRDEIYAQERRWCGRRFWRSRQRPTQTAPSRAQP